MTERIVFCRGCGNIYPESEKSKHRLCSLGEIEVSKTVVVKEVKSAKKTKKVVEEKAAVSGAAPIIESAGNKTEVQETTRSSDKRGKYIGSDGKFDRKAYHRDYMRERMRRLRKKSN